MKTQTNRNVTHLEGSIWARLRQDMEAGIAVSRDPSNAALADLAARITTMHSLWYTRTCIECQHNFREGDRVRQCPMCGQAYHDDRQYHLHCWQTHFTDDHVCKTDGYDAIADVHRDGCPYRWPGRFPDTVPTIHQAPIPNRRIEEEVTRQFLRGLETEWKPFGDKAVYELREGDVIIGRRCPWCRYSMRPGIGWSNALVGRAKCISTMMCFVISRAGMIGMAAKVAITVPPLGLGLTGNLCARKMRYDP